MNKSGLFWQTYLQLEKEALELSRYIYFTDEIIVNVNGAEVSQSCTTQLDVFSPYIADLLVRCCVQIEAISKELYFDNGGTKPRGDSSIFFDEDCLKLIDIKWQTHNKIVMITSPSFNFTKEENRAFRPLKNAHKRQGTSWEKAYQAVKHDRYSSLQRGTVKAFLHALAALYLLNIYYRDESWTTTIKDVSNDDYSVGSSIFSVKPPEHSQLLNENNPSRSDSPFVVKIETADFERIKEIKQRENLALSNYISQQPEWSEQGFINQMQKAIEREQKDPHQRVMPMWELSQYRLRKQIPDTLSFEEKKDLLIHSQEWNGWIHQHNNHLTADELTEENIQKEIDTVGRLWGMELERQYQKLEWVPFALNKAVCKVFIPN